MVELADTIDLGSIPRGCRFKSCYPHEKRAHEKEIHLFHALFLFVLIVFQNPFRKGNRGLSPAKLFRKAGGVEDVKNVHIGHTQIGFQKGIDKEGM